MKDWTGIGRPILLGLLGIMFLVSCRPEEEPEKKPVSVQSFDPASLVLDTPELEQGREIWMATCAQCHIRGLGGAPKIGDIAAWAPRIAKGKEVLYDHALHGFVGPQLNEMPAKGGFTDLTDDEVKLAVDFVVFASQ